MKGIKNIEKVLINRLIMMDSMLEKVHLSFNSADNQSITGPGILLFITKDTNIKKIPIYKA